MFPTSARRFRTNQTPPSIHRWFFRCDRLNLNCRNEAGNTAADIARSTGQALLMNHGSDVNPAYVEAVPQWEQGMHTEAAGVGVGATSVTMYASVVGEGACPFCRGCYCNC